MGFSRQECWSGLPFPPPGGSSPPRDRTHISYVSRIGRQILYHKHHLGSPHKVPRGAFKIHLHPGPSPDGGSWHEALASDLKACQQLPCESRRRGRPEVSGVTLLPAPHAPRERESSREQETARPGMCSLPCGAQTHAPLSQALERITRRPRHTNTPISVWLRERAVSRRQPRPLCPASVPRPLCPASVPRPLCPCLSAPASLPCLSAWPLSLFLLPDFPPCPDRRPTPAVLHRPPGHSPWAPGAPGRQPPRRLQAAGTSSQGQVWMKRLQH